MGADRGSSTLIPSWIIFPARAVRPLWDSAALSKLLERQAPILQEYERALRVAATDVLAFLDARQAAL